MKIFYRISFTIAVALSFAIPSRGQNYQGVLCDSNYVILSGYFINLSQVVNGTSVTNGLAGVTYVNTATNYIVTNTSATFLAQSNYFEGMVAWLLGTNFSQIAQGGWSIGGVANTVSSGTVSSRAAGMVGGATNQVLNSPAAGIVGGVLDTIEADGSAGSDESFIGGGMRNTIFTPYSAIVGGTNNTIFNGAGWDIILAGANNFNWGGAYDVMAGLGNVIGSTINLNVTNSFVFGAYAAAAYNGCFVWNGYAGITNQFAATGTNQFIVHAAGGIGLNTNNPGTNSVRLAGVVDVEGSLQIGETDLFTLFNPVAVSNALSIIWNFNLTSASNGLYGAIVTNQANILAVSNSQVIVSNQLFSFETLTTNSINTVSNQAWTVGANNTNNLVGTSNVLQSQIGAFTQIKAMTAELPSTYASIGIGFNTPLMPDGNFSVSLVPQDETTAGAILSGMPIWVDSKTSSGFTIHGIYATNLDLHFDCIVKENTQ